MIKYAVLTLTALALTACMPGERLGTFKNMCKEKRGTLEQVGSNDYVCHLKDGTLLRSN